MPLGSNSYGKGGVRLVRVFRDEGRHRLMDLDVSVMLTGDFDGAFHEGDNRTVLPTDTMKNAVYALAAEADGCPEHFARQLAEYVLATDTPARAVRIEMTERPWEHVDFDGRAHPHAFTEAGSERRFAAVTAGLGTMSFEGGVRNLRILKTTGSAFEDFLTDPYTTLPDAPDRLLATVLDATWKYTSDDVPFDPAYADVRRTLIETFAAHESRSVQHTLHEMGEAVLAVRSEVGEISIKMPNWHHLLVDLSPFDMANDGEIYHPVDEPYGVIEGTLVRG